MWGKDPKEDKLKDPKEDKLKDPKEDTWKDPKEDKWEINRKSQIGHKKQKRKKKKIEGGNTTIPFERSTPVLHFYICTT